MQLMLAIYAFPPDDTRASRYPTEFTVDFVRGYRLT